jgi:hypothetical protein
VPRGNLRCAFLGGGSNVALLPESFSLCDKHCFPFLQDHGPRAGDLRFVELSFLILFANSIPLNVTSAFPNVLNPSIG